MDVPPAGTGGAGGASTKLDAPTGTGGTTTLSTGAKCTDDSQCTLGFCVDGVCCDSRCGGQCQACAETGSVGTCTTVSSGDPRGTRTPCAGTGKCKGQCDISSATACKMPGNTTVCLAETCSAGQHTPESVCNSAGACPGQTASACASGSCATDGSGTCLGACTSTSCPTDHYCASTGSCAPKKGNGTGNGCTAPGQCSSGYCAADGICCPATCTGECQTCDNTSGSCTQVTSGQPKGGRAACTNSADTTCGGRCAAGSADCTYPTNSTPCGTASCSSNYASVIAPSCNSAYCDTGATNSCTGGQVCVGAACSAKIATNSTTACQVNGQCQSGLCCTGTCRDPSSDNSNCGGCGNPCATGQTCSGALAFAPEEQPNAVPPAARHHRFALALLVVRQARSAGLVNNVARQPTGAEGSSTAALTMAAVPRGYTVAVELASAMQARVRPLPAARSVQATRRASSRTTSAAQCIGRTS